jgi:hypothetical protein
MDEEERELDAVFHEATAGAGEGGIGRGVSANGEIGGDEGESESESDVASPSEIIGLPLDDGASSDLSLGSGRQLSASQPIGSGDGSEVTGRLMPPGLKRYTPRDPRVSMQPPRLIHGP